MSEYIKCNDETGNEILVKITEKIQAIFKRGTIVRIDKLNKTFLLRVKNTANSGLIEDSHMMCSEQTLASIYIVLYEHFKLKNIKIEELVEQCQPDNNITPFEIQGYDIELAKKILNTNPTNSISDIIIEDEENSLFTEIAKKYYQ